MGRRNRQRQQPYHLDSGAVTTLTREEIASVLRAAEDLITLGGRTLLVKVLRGSQANDVRPELRENPAYGAWKEFPHELVSQRVDWCVEQGYLGLEYFGKLPLLVYEPRGLAIECQTIAKEWFQMATAGGFESIHDAIPQAPLPTLNALLDRIADSGSAESRAILDEWKPVATKRLGKRIRAIFAEWDGSGPRSRFVFDTCWIDESLPFAAEVAFNDYARKNAILTGEMRWIGRDHPGMMDVEIYRALLLRQRACLVTTDRPFHNALCQERVASFFLDENTGQFTSAPLTGVKPRGILARLPQTRTEAPVPASPPPDGNPLYHLLVSRLPPAALKRVRTKRRRIRNYFGGSAYTSRCSVTISTEMSRGRPLVGVRLRILADSGVKALEATESYFIETSGDLSGAYIQAAVLMIRLKLEQTPTNFYYDALRLPAPDDLADSPGYEFWRALTATFAEIKIHRIAEHPRNPSMDRLRRKLRDLAARPTNTNEVVDEDSLALAQGWEESRGLET